MRVKRARSPRRCVRGTRTASGVTDVVLDSVTGRFLAVDDAASGSLEEWSDDVDAHDGAIEIASSLLWLSYSSTTVCFSAGSPLVLLPISCFFAPEIGAGS